MNAPYQQMNYTANQNGKLFNDIWNDVRLHNPGKYKRDNHLVILLKNVEFGNAMVLSVRTFPFKTLNDTTSFLAIGKPAIYHAEVLRRIYFPKAPRIHPDTLFDHVVLKYTWRNLENQQLHLQDWFSNLYQQFKQTA